MPKAKTLATTTDKDGRSYYLTDERWDHIENHHPEMRGLQQEIMDVVRDPDKRLPGSRPGTERLCKRGPGPARWLVVVVAQPRAGASRVVTAYPSTKDPKPLP
jgi:hypothetical protein